MRIQSKNNGLILVLFLIIFSAHAQNEQIDQVLLQLDIPLSRCKEELVAIKKTPNHPDETIMVIPEIISVDEYHYELSGHVVIVDTETSKIKYRNVESDITYTWDSDAVELNSISIDTAPYMITNEVRAFGIRLGYYAHSRANPYSKQTLTLFVKDKESSLRRILNELLISESEGEYDGRCASRYSDTSKILIMSENTTNGYNDIISQSTKVDSKTYETQTGDCEEKTISKTKDKQVLKYEHGHYH
ncbi:PA3715 family protein [Reichenbachiella versicolor]|uniref:hypothetical protein n=1 Tax=Reichenbachiella versicolor TaxID=1821036 RepID=UPI000D6E7177|nr:hypothetical protein [Reichenbachiella versicolor]